MEVGSVEGEDPESGGRLEQQPDHTDAPQDVSCGGGHQRTGLHYMDCGMDPESPTERPDAWYSTKESVVLLQKSPLRWYFDDGAEIWISFLHFYRSRRNGRNSRISVNFGDISDELIKINFKI